MTINIHKVITGNPKTKNLMKLWGSNKEKTIFNKYTGPRNDQVIFDNTSGKIFKINDMYHDIAYAVAQNIGKNDKQKIISR